MLRNPNRQQKTLIEMVMESDPHLFAEEEDDYVRSNQFTHPRNQFQGSSQQRLHLPSSNVPRNSPQNVFDLEDETPKPVTQEPKPATQEPVNHVYATIQTQVPKPITIQEPIIQEHTAIQTQEPINHTPAAVQTQFNVNENSAGQTQINVHENVAGQTQVNVHENAADQTQEPIPLVQNQVNRAVIAEGRVEQQLLATTLKIDKSTNIGVSYEGDNVYITMTSLVPGRPVNIQIV